MKILYLVATTPTESSAECGATNKPENNPSHSPLDKGASDRPHPAPDRCPSAYLADNWLQRGPDMPLRGF